MNNHFTLIVAGEDHADLIKEYDSNKETERHYIYRFKDAKNIKQKYITLYEATLLNIDMDKKTRASVEKRFDELKSMDDVDFYADISSEYEIDENGDAYTDTNINGKYDTCKIGKNLSMPLIDKDGNETFSEIKSNIDWSRIHKWNTHTYERVWEMCVEGDKPNDEEEKKLFDNMKNREQYFKYFGDKETYVLSNTSFSGSAFLSEKTGWIELENNEDMNEWIKTFYEKFIVPLNDNERITVYECTRF